jgi:hypothetical protein
MKKEEEKKKEREDEEKKKRRRICEMKKRRKVRNKERSKGKKIKQYGKKKEKEKKFDKRIFLLIVFFAMFLSRISARSVSSVSAKSKFYFIKRCKNLLRVFFFFSFRPYLIILKKQKIVILRYFMYSSLVPPAGKDLKAQVSFLGHTSQMLDLYVSFARQAAQAMTISVSKTLYPIRNTPDMDFAPVFLPEATADESSSLSVPAIKLTALNNQERSEGYTMNTEGISFEYDRWTVNRSPFVHGRHQDQFEVRTYRRQLDLFDADTETVKRWLHYVSTNLPAGIGVEYQLVDYEPFAVEDELSPVENKTTQ